MGEGFTLNSFTGEVKNDIPFTRKTQCVNELRVKAKGESGNCELAECAMCRCVSVRAYGCADEETVGDMMDEGTGVFSKKAGRKKRKEGAFRKKVHKFSFVLSLFSKNLRLFETKLLLLRLIKHNFPFIPPHCGVHIVQSRGTFPDHPAQTLFDLLNSSRLCFIPAYRNMSQKMLSPKIGGSSKCTRFGTVSIRPSLFDFWGACFFERKPEVLF